MVWTSLSFSVGLGCSSFKNRAIFKMVRKKSIFCCHCLMFNLVNFFDFSPLLIGTFIIGIEVAYNWASYLSTLSMVISTKWICFKIIRTNLVYFKTARQSYSLRLLPKIHGKILNLKFKLIWYVKMTLTCRTHDCQAKKVELPWMLSYLERLSYWVPEWAELLSTRIGQVPERVECLSWPSSQMG